MTEKSPQERFLLARACAVRTFPYLETVIIAMGYAVDERIVNQNGSPTMAVTERAQILVHPAFMEEIISCGGVKALGFVIAHEALHVLMGHIARTKKLLAREPDADMKLVGIAQDLSINPSLRQASQKAKAGIMSITPPIGACEGVFPEQYNLPEGLTFEMYYARLKAQKKEGDKPEEKSKGDGPGQGCTPDMGSSGDQLSDDAKAVGDEVTGWAEGRLDRMIQTAAAKAQEAEARAKGSVPAGLLLDMAEACKPPSVDWRDAFRALVCHHAEHSKGAEDGIWTVPSRRQAGVGYGLGKPRLPGLVEYKPMIGVILDTSGSMGSELQRAVDEIVGIIDCIGGDVEFITCDTTATVVGRVGSASQIKQNLKGGGGTDMNDALDKLATKRVDVGVCVTDGYIGDPGGDRGYPLIWCLTPNGGDHDLRRSITDGWARLVKIDKDEP